MLRWAETGTVQFQCSVSEYRRKQQRFLGEPPTRTKDKDQDLLPQLLGKLGGGRGFGCGHLAEIPMFGESHLAQDYVSFPGQRHSMADGLCVESPRFLTQLRTILKGH